MYFLNVVHLKQFYASPLGKKVGALLAQRVRQAWPKMQNETMLALGYPIPLLSADQDASNTLAVCMPAEQGALYWPPDGDGRVFLSREGKLPLPDHCINRVLIVHTFEYTAELRELMQELWRVLMPSGRMIAIVPNRLSLWARLPRSPFGYGRPFSAAQIREMMEQSQLTYLNASTSLFFPPSNMHWLLKIAGFLEWTGRLLLPFLGGVWIVEAEKQIYASIKQPILATAPARAIPVGMAQPTA